MQFYIISPRLDGWKSFQFCSQLEAGGRRLRRGSYSESPSGDPPAPLLTPILVSSFQFTGIFSKPILVYFFFLMTYLIYPCLPDFFCRSEGCEGTGATAALHKIHNNVQLLLCCSCATSSSPQFAPGLLFSIHGQAKHAEHTRLSGHIRYPQLNVFDLRSACSILPFVGTFRHKKSVRWELLVLFFTIQLRKEKREK